MSNYHDKRRKPGRVSEPVQVYLDAPDRQRLDRLTTHLGTTKSGVLREALEALENQLTDTARHPALRIIGIAGHDAGGAVRGFQDFPGIFRLLLR